jgi:streptogramin lyase
MNGSNRILGAAFTAAVAVLIAVASAAAAVPDPQDAQLGAGADEHANTGDTGVVHEYQLPTAGTQPAEIVTGPDGNLWFTGFGNGTIARSTTDRTTTVFPTPSGATSSPDGITVGPDGDLWFAETGSSRIGRSTSNGTIMESLPTPTANSGPAEITSGPDDALWFTERFGHRIGRIGLDGTITAEYLLPTAINQPLGITLGPDGNLWFTESPGNRIGRITPAGVVSELPVLPHPQSQPWEITAGPDGNLWFTERLGNRIGRLSTDGTLTEFPVPTPKALPNTIRPGPDPNAARDCRVERRTLGEGAFELEYGGGANAFGACVDAHATTHSLWFTEESGKVGEITTDGVVTEFDLPSSNGQPLGVTGGPDGNVCFTEFKANRLASLGVDVVGPH